MKKNMFAIALGVAALASASSAFAQTVQHNDGWFVNGAVGRAELDHGRYDDHTTGYAANLGYRWAVAPALALGVEGGYNDLGNIHAKNAFNNRDVVDNGKSQLHGWTAGVNGKYNFSPEWYVSARGGIYGWKGHGTSNNENPVREGLDDTSWYAGAGVGYDFRNNVSLGINYDHFDAQKHNLDLSTDMVSVSAEYRF
jgi:OOP family OmpA-OmpF porin